MGWLALDDFKPAAFRGQQQLHPRFTFSTRDSDGSPWGPLPTLWGMEGWEGPPQLTAPPAMPGIGEVGFPKGKLSVC